MKQMRIQNLAISLLIATATLTGCASNGDNAGPIQNIKEASDRRLNKLPAEILYARARRATDTGSYTNALSLYDRIDTRFPFSDVARQAQLERAYVHFRQHNELSAISAVNRFINQYPRHKNIAYAYYLKGLASFRFAAPDDDHWYSSDKTTRDIGSSREAFFAFAQVVNNYPQSPYAADARRRMLHLRDRMAKHYLNVMEYYERKSAWVAVVNRGQLILENYQGSKYVPATLDLMIKAYTELNLDDLAEDTRRLRDENYRQSENQQNTSKTTEPLKLPTING